MHLRPSLHFFPESVFLIHKEQHSKYNFLSISLRESRWCEITNVTDLYHCTRLNSNTYQQKCAERSRHVDCCTQIVESCHRPPEHAAGEREKVLGSLGILTLPSHIHSAIQLLESTCKCSVQGRTTDPELTDIYFATTVCDSQEGYV